MRWTRMAMHRLAGAAILRVVFPRADGASRRAWVGWWSAKLLRIAGLRTRVEGVPPVGADAGAMIAANHISWLDIFAISSVRPTRFIAKSEIRDWPIAGWVVERAGTIFIRRDRRRETTRINELVNAALGAGDHVGLFPEGMTTEGDRLLRFHSSLFEPAVANRARVHPCAIRYEHADGTLCRAMAYVGETSFMESFTLALRQRGVTVRLAFAAPIATEGFSRREVALRAEDAVASLLGVAKEDKTPRRGSDPPAAPR
ncbi:MAG TPA: lysophospholipid acyltransferase family protein [Usitatibacter sp.]|nr:lysophospholipid acyltransferase family protein [Usitatibacter sp.]